jgi:serine/threonine protein kinase
MEGYGEKGKEEYPLFLDKAHHESLRQHGLHPEKVNDMLRDAPGLKHALGGFATWAGERYESGYSSETGSSLGSLITTGKQGLVLQRGDSVLKFTSDPEREKSVLESLGKLKSPPKNAIHTHRSKKTSDSSHVVMPNLGKTLAEYLQERVFPARTTYRYGESLLNGLIELRRGGARQHRDIRPANIIINTKTREPVIIDYGRATPSKQPVYEAHKDYAGWNDLTALGQTLYHMNTGDKIKNSDFSRRGKHRISRKALTKVKRIKHPSLRSVTESLLSAGNDDLREIERIKEAHYSTK